MSGGGTKAGGRDYLQNFLLPRVVTEKRHAAWICAGGSARDPGQQAG